MIFLMCCLVTIMGVLKAFISLLCIVTNIVDGNPNVISLKNKEPLLILIANKSPKRLPARTNTANELLSFFNVMNHDATRNNEKSNDSYELPDSYEVPETPTQKFKGFNFKLNKLKPYEYLLSTPENDKMHKKKKIDNNHGKGRRPNKYNGPYQTNKVTKRPYFKKLNKHGFKMANPFLNNKNNIHSSHEIDENNLPDNTYPDSNNRPDKYYDLGKINKVTTLHHKPKKQKNVQSLVYELIKNQKRLDKYSYVNTDAPDTYTEPDSVNYPDYINYTDIYIESNNHINSDKTNKKWKESRAIPDEVDLFKALLNLLSLFALYINNIDYGNSGHDITEKNWPKGDVDISSVRPDSYEVESYGNTDGYNYPDNYNEPTNPINIDKIKEEREESNYKSLGEKKKRIPKYESLLIGHKKKENEHELLEYTESIDRTESYDTLEPTTDKEEYNYPEDQTNPSVLNEDKHVARLSKFRAHKRLKEKLDCDLVMECSPECYYKCG